MAKVSVKFKSNKAAEEFAAAFSVLGDKAAVEIKESTAIVSSDDPKALRFVKQSANEYVEELYCKSMANRLLAAITECISNGNETTVQLMDNSTQKVTVRHAEVIASVYDRLSEENQTAFLVLATESKDTYAHTVNFAKANEESN
jgi:hypothetical protein